MAKTYDFNTVVGKVRFYAAETDIDVTPYTDEEIQGLLDEADNDINLAVSKLWEAKASAAVVRAGKETIGNVSTDYSSVVQFAMKQAEIFRNKAMSEPYAETAEISGTDFQKRDILLKEFEW